MGCGSSKATPIVPTPQRLVLPLPDGDAPESVVSRSVTVGKQISLVDGKYARCELTLDNTTTKLVGTLKPEPNERLERRPSDDGAYTTEQILANLPVLPTKAGARLLVDLRLLDVTANRLPDDAKAELREVAAVRGDEVLIDLGDDDGK